MPSEKGLTIRSGKENSKQYMNSEYRKQLLPLGLRERSKLGKNLLPKAEMQISLERVRLWPVGL